LFWQAQEFVEIGLKIRVFVKKVRAPFSSPFLRLSLFLRWGWGGRAGERESRGQGREEELGGVVVAVFSTSSLGVL
jgi:hypothetical protein